MRHLWGITACALIVATVAIWILWLPLPADLQTPLLGTPTLLDIHGREIAELPSLQARVQLPITLPEMGDWLPRITVALEDRGFYRHSGIDWQATAAAVLRNLKAGRVVAGGSTITQQLVKMACHRQQR